MHSSSYIMFSRLRVQESEQALAEVEKQKNLGMTIVGLVGHDLQSPLSVIKTAASTIHADGVEDQDSAPAIILRSTDKAVQLLDDLVYWGRGMQGALYLDHRPVAVAPIVEGAWGDLGLLPSRKLLALQTDILPRTTAVADADALRAVVRNLLSNAAKFSSSDSVIVAEASAIGDRLHLRIRDEGAGMPPDVVENLRQGLNTTGRPGTRGEKGKDIGMQMVHFMCREAGWGLEVESSEGAGTTVTLVLSGNGHPASKPPSAALTGD